MARKTQRKRTEAVSPLSSPVQEKTYRFRVVVLVLSLFVLFSLGGCAKGGDDKAGSGQGPTSRKIEFPVEVQPVKTQKVEYAVTAVGSVEAFEHVEVNARVAGIVERVLLREGESVSQGTVLVEIEPNRFGIAVRSAQAMLEKTKAELAEAEASLARREAANEKNPGLIRGEEIETFRTRARTSTAEVAQQEAALEQARLNLRDAIVRAPVAGTIQTRTVQTGQYVQPGTLLATLVRRDPLILRFQIPEQESSRLHAGQRADFSVGDDARSYRAKISLVAGSASMESRMVNVTAIVDDPARSELTPGAFARVTVPVGSSALTPVIPQTAIRPSELGFLAYVIEDGVAHARVLTLGLRTAAGDVEVKSGLTTGEMLVVRGAEALRDGVAVKVE